MPTDNDVHAIGLWWDGQFLEMSKQLVISILEMKVVNHTQLTSNGRCLLVKNEWVCLCDTVYVCVCVCVDVLLHG